MSGEHWTKATELFEQALERPPAEREAFVAAACPDDSALRERVLAMLRADQRSSPLLDAGPEDLAAAVGAEAPRLEGRRIGPYTVIRVLGQGGMGVVCLAQREDVGKQVALKLVAGGLAAPERVTRFLLERRVLAQLEHPNIATLVDAGVAEDGSPWLAMEYVPGEAIDAYCAAHDLALPDRLRLFAKICHAVGYAHQHLVVHRDLKPSNILVAADGEPRLLDFGIAKLLSDTAGDGPVTATGALMTPQYAAPEQFTGGAITTATDVYQLGALLFELLTGRRPTPHEPVPPPSSVAGRRLRGDIDTIVLKATELEPSRRYATAEQLGEDVQRHVAGLPIAAGTPSAAYRFRRFVRRHKWGTGVAAAAGLGLLGFTLAMGIQVRRTEIERARAEEVSRLLTDVFAGADPTVAQGDTVTVRSVLDRGAQRIEANLAIDPTVKARLLGVIARAYENLGQLARAVELQQEAVTLLRGEPPDDPARLQALGQLGLWEAESDHKDLAYRAADDALATARTLPYRRRAELAEALNAAGFVRQRAGAFAAARPLYEEALGVYRTLPGSGPLGVEHTLVNLAYLAQNRGDLPAAETYFRETLDRRRARLGLNHSLTAKSMLDLSGVLIRTGRADEAERLVREATAIHRRVFTGPSREAMQGLSAMAGVLAARGKAAEAEAAQREALGLARLLYGDSSGDVAMAIANLAGYVQRTGRLDEAAELHREAVRRFTGRLGARHPSTAVSITNLAWTERLRNRLAESETLYRRALPVLDSAWRGTPQITSMLVDFGIVLRLRHECATGEPVLRRAVALASAAWPPTNGDVLRAQRFLGLCLVDLNRFAAAESILTDAHQTMVKGYGPTNQYTVAMANDLAVMYERCGRPADAARYRATGGQR